MLIITLITRSLVEISKNFLLFAPLFFFSEKGKGKAKAYYQTKVKKKSNKKMASEFVIDGLFLYRQYDEQVYIEHPRTNPIEIVVRYAGEDCLMSIDSFIYELYEKDINIYYIFHGIPADRLIKLQIPDDNYILYPNISKVNKFYIPYPLSDPTLELKRQTIFNEYLLMNM